MKLLDLIYAVGSMTRNVANVIRYPFQIASQTVQNTARNKLEEIDVPFSQSKSADPKPQIANASKNTIHRSVSPGWTVVSTASSANSTLNSTLNSTSNSAVLPNQTASAAAIQTPTLTGQFLQGRRSKYQVETLLQEHDRLRLYRGSRSLNNLPVLIKEYDLTNFNSHEIRQAKRKLERLDSLSFRSGGVQDFRLVVPSDTFVNLDAKRGYVITAYVAEDRLTLRDYLIQVSRRGEIGLPAAEVRQILSQVLQTLWFMHNQPVRFADGAIQRGVPHGNLNLDSLLRIPDRVSNGHHPSQFYIYVNDLGIWKEPFQLEPTNLPSSVSPNQPIKRDLISLGMVGLYLLVGEIEAGYPDRFSDPREHPQWNEIYDEPLKAWIRQMLGLDRTVAYSNAEEARQALERLVVVPETTTDELDTFPTTAENHRWLILATVLMLLTAFGIGLLAWRLLVVLLRPVPELIRPDPTKIESVADVPQKPVQFGVAESWKNVLGQGRVATNLTFAEVLAQRGDRKFGQYRENNRLPFKNNDEILTDLQANKVSFILGTWDEATHKDLQHEVVAYDGVVVFVAFSDPERSHNVAKALQGQLSFQQLQKLYANASEGRLSSTLEEMPIKLYAPRRDQLEDRMTVQLFEEKVLQSSDLINQFYAALGKQIQERDFNSMVASILQDFENDNSIGIGFGRLSKVLGQCSVYPLAIGPAGQEVQPISTNQAAITPAFDLCDRKGSYAPNAKLFKSERYPLIYPLSVIYTEEGAAAAKAFIAALKTDEGQCLLTAAGLVPIKPVHQTGDCMDAEQ